MLGIVWAFAIIIGWIFLAFSPLIGIGDFLYLWGHMSLPIGTSAWQGFLLYLKTFFGGMFLIISAAFFSKF